ncbi:unnamed protein product [Boreogadus saida]
MLEAAQQHRRTRRVLFSQHPATGRGAASPSCGPQHQETGATGEKEPHHQEATGGADVVQHTIPTRGKSKAPRLASLGEALHGDVPTSPT